MKWGKGPDIKGEVTEATHKEWIAIDSVSLTTGRAVGGQIGSGQEKRHRGLPTISDMQISRSIDKSSPLLFNASVAGKPTNVVIHLMEPAKGSNKPMNKVVEWELRNCVITTYHLGGTGGGGSETFSLNFTGINFKYTPYDQTDTAQATANGFFDLTTAKCSAVTLS
jgi:type VI secretion system secreted protein Hcp